MNIYHLQYIIDTAEIGSISKAASKLYMSQSYLSKIIQDMETQLNIMIFSRSNKGVKLTREGTEFINYAKNILAIYGDIKKINQNKTNNKKNLSISTVRSSLVMESFLDLMDNYKDEKVRFVFRETDSMEPIKDVYYLNSELGILYIEDSEKNDIMKKIKRYNLIYKKLCNFDIHIVLGANHKLAKKDKINIEELYKYGLVRYRTSSLPFNKMNYSSDYFSNIIDMNRIKNIVEVSDRGSLHNILSQSDYFAIGTQAAYKQEELFNIVSIPIEGLKHIEGLEMGYIHHKSVELTVEAKRFLEIIKNKYKEKDKV